MQNEPSSFHPSSHIPHPSNEPRVQELLDEIFNSERTPEEVCGACPELLPEVRKRWQEMRLVESELDAMFPTPGPDANGATAALGHPDTELPQIPGYEIGAVLGHGGMGVVYKARQLSLNRTVALKMLLGGAYAGPRERARFLREAEAVAGLRHPNLVQVHDVGDYNGLPYFTMEHVEGGSLAQKLLGTPQPFRQAAALVATLAEAVQVAHQGGIVHRDLKPANILLQRKSEVPNSKLQARDPKTESVLPPPKSNFEFRISDFDPKIADFGLARHFDTGPSLTLNGARVGTPSYMAPEQAMGKTRTIGPSVDIYSLGAILYELLTGRPPFRGETSAETELQVISQDPVPPSRLNARVPRDLETICLKCLHKDPQGRYATAAALADDLRRFQRGESIAARPVGPLERFGKWVRRRPAAAALLGATAFFTIVLIGGALWLVVQRAQQRQAVEGDLREVADLQQQARWTDARGALQKAEARLDAGGPGDLRERIDQARGNLDLVTELDRIRLSRITSGNLVSPLGRTTSGNLVFYKAKADQDYTKAFGDSGLANVPDPPDIMAARIQTSTVRVALMAALADWAVCATDKEKRDWLLTVARIADPDPQGWRDRIRDPASWEDPAALTELARTVQVKGSSVPLLLALAELLGAAGGDAPAFLKRVQIEHPADFWVNLILGDALLAVAPVDAGGCYRAALASRPGAAVAYTALGDALRAQNLRDEAVGYYRRAVDIDPQYARGHTNLGNVLNDMGRTDEAAACYRRALEVDPTYGWAHFDLANMLRDAGRMDEALVHYRQYLAVDPTHVYVAHVVRADLVRQGRGEELRQEWKKALRAGPPEHDAWFGYAELCLYLGHEDEYRQARQDLLRHFGATSDPYVAERVARTMLLFPAAGDELQTAAALADRAVAAKETTAQWIYPYFLFAHGLAEYRQGRFDSAISIMKADAGTVMGPAPRLVIAMAQYRKGHEEEARATLAGAIAGFDWRMAQVISRDHWIWHALRREAESVILPNLPDFMDGKHQPQNNDERLALLGVRQFTNCTRATARLYADAFAVDPPLADDLGAGHRYNAARAAAQAGCGQGADAPGLGEEERARLREQARQWLRADLAARARAFDAGSTATREANRRALTRWRNEPDLAGLREPGELDRLPADERKACLALWAELDAVLARTQK
jgi:serine/threonine protein kinase/tetratricopeptide (TPR) repeat protein